MRNLIQILIVIYPSWNEWIHCSKMWHIFILGPDLSKRGMTAKMGIGNLDPDPVGDHGIVRIQDLVLDPAVLWKMETKNQSSNIFCKKKQQQNNHLWILTSRRKKRTALFSFVLFTSALPRKTRIITKVLFK